MIDKRLQYKYGKRVGFEPGGMAGEYGQGPGVGADGHTAGTRGDGGGYRGPAELGVTTRSVNPVTMDPVDRSAVDQFSNYGKNVMTQNLANVKGPGFFDSTLGKIVKNVGLGVFAPQLLGPKFATGMKALKVGKLAKNFIDETDIFSALSNNLTNTGKTKGTKRTKGTKGTDETFNFGGEGGEGLAALEDVDALENEYLLLMQKMQLGNYTDDDRVRYTMLKTMLGK